MECQPSQLCIPGCSREGHLESPTRGFAIHAELACELLSREELRKIREEELADIPENREMFEMIDAFLESPPQIYPDIREHAADLKAWCLFLPPLPDCEG